MWGQTLLKDRKQGNMTCFDIAILHWAHRKNWFLSFDYFFSCIFVFHTLVFQSFFFSSSQCLHWSLSNQYPLFCSEARPVTIAEYSLFVTNLFSFSLFFNKNFKALHPKCPLEIRHKTYRLLEMDHLQRVSAETAELILTVPPTSYTHDQWARYSDGKN